MSGMKDVLAAHTFAEDDTCGCTCDKMFYDWRRTPEEVQIEHRLHVEERLTAAGYGSQYDAWFEGAYFSTAYGPAQPNDNPYPAPSREQHEHKTNQGE